MIHRREFLSRAAFGVAALALPGCVSTRGASGRAPSGMFLSLPPWAVARNVGWPEQARVAARAGYKGIDLSFGPAKAAGVAATRALFAELAIEPTIVNLPMRDPFGGDDAAFAGQLTMLDGDAAFCRAVGCGRFAMVLLPTTLNGSSKAEHHALVHRRLSAIAPVLAKHDVRLSMEFLGPLMFRQRRNRAGDTGPLPPQPVPFVWSLRETLPICIAAGPNVGVTLDAWHWYHSGGTVADIRSTDASRIVHVHVSDARPMAPEDVRDDVRLLPGEGAIDLIGFFEALKAIGYRGGVSPETLGPRIPNDMPADESARLALKYTVAVMKRAGVA